MNLDEFIDTYRDAITERVIASYPPIYSPATRLAPDAPTAALRPWARRRTRFAGAALSL